MTYVKICGIMETVHALRALELGADLVGFVLAPSRRQVPPEAAALMIQRCRQLFPPSGIRWQAVGVFANQPLDFVQSAAAVCAFDVVQLSGQEPMEYCQQISVPIFRTVHVPELLRTGMLRGAGSGHESGGDESREGEGPPEPPGIGRRRGGGGPPQPPGVRPRAVRREPHPPTGGAAGDKPLPYDVEAAIQRALGAIKGGTGATRLLLDSGGAGRWGGTGEAFHWDRIGNVARECIVAGGLTPANVADAIRAMHPWGVDVSSGVESGGRKDPDQIRRFIEEVRRIDRYAAG